MKRRMMTALTTLALAGSGMIAGAAAAGAEPAAEPGGPPSDGPPAGISEDQAAAMERDLGIDRDEIAERTALDARTAQLDETLDQALGTAYAGTWLPEGADRPTVAVTRASALEDTDHGDADVVVVEHGLDRLESWKEALDDVEKAPAEVHAWYVDPTTNAVTVETSDPDAASELAASAGVPADAVQVAEAAEEYVPLRDIRGGDEFHRPTGDGYVTLCSTGFAVQGGFVTAGHCGSTGDSVTAPDGAALGTYQGSTFPGNDYAWVATTGGWNPTPLVNDHAGGTVSVAGHAEQAVGAAVCRSGRTSGWRCGTITGKDVTVQYGTDLVYGMATSTACAEGGDSGGAVISGNQAQGVTSGGSGDCSSGGNSIYQPLDPILDTYGLQLVTTGGSDGRPIVGLAGKCIDVPNSDFSDGKQLQLWTCNGTDAQRWTFAADGTVRIADKCMDVAWGDTANGTPVQIVACNGNAAQQFVLSGAGDLVSVLADKCVDVVDQNSADGSRLHLWECHGGASQKWTLG